MLRRFSNDVSRFGNNDLSVSDVAEDPEFCHIQYNDVACVLMDVY